MGQSPRIIPTRMGTRITCWKSLLSTGDHPHAYGDKACLLLYPYHNQGSSPRVWGQVTTSTDTPGRDRIIPTRMGTSLYDYLLCFHKRDHPHAYGDKYLLMILVILMEGSSPRVWGQVYRDSCTVLGSRIIPTRMGTRCYWRFIRPLGRDHPHAYGDKENDSIMIYNTIGSSPRVWGQD